MKYREGQSSKQSKKSKDNKKIEELTNELASKNELLLRTAAEFDNFKKIAEIYFNRNDYDQFMGDEKFECTRTILKKYAERTQMQLSKEIK